MWCQRCLLTWGITQYLWIICWQVGQHCGDHQDMMILRTSFLTNILLQWEKASRDFFWYCQAAVRTSKSMWPLPWRQISYLIVIEFSVCVSTYLLFHLCECCFCGRADKCRIGLSTAFGSIFQDASDLILIFVPDLLMSLFSLLVHPFAWKIGLLRVCKWTTQSLHKSLERRAVELLLWPFRLALVWIKLASRSLNWWKWTSRGPNRGWVRRKRTKCPHCVQIVSWDSFLWFNL